MVGDFKPGGRGVEVRGHSQWDTTDGKGQGEEVTRVKTTTTRLEGKRGNRTNHVIQTNQFVQNRNYSVQNSNHLVQNNNQINY